MRFSRKVQSTVIFIEKVNQMRFLLRLNDSFGLSKEKFRAAKPP